MRRDNKLTPTVMALCSQLDKGAEIRQDWIVEGEETRIKSRMDDETELCVLILKPFVTGRSQFGFDSKYDSLN